MTLMPVWWGIPLYRLWRRGMNLLLYVQLSECLNTYHCDWPEIVKTCSMSEGSSPSWTFTQTWNWIRKGAFMYSWKDWKNQFDSVETDVYLHLNEEVGDDPKIYLLTQFLNPQGGGLQSITMRTMMRMARKGNQGRQMMRPSYLLDKENFSLKMMDKSSSKSP